MSWLLLGLVRHGLHLGVADDNDNTLLHAAILGGHQDCAERLIDAGAVNHRLAHNQQQADPLLLAMARNMLIV